MPSNTQECLLDAAESLFLENGFAAMSLRSIAEKADVNLAATNYHFGSKQGLLEAMVHRRVTPINEKRLFQLDQLQAGAKTPSVEQILQAFLEPLLSHSGSSHFPQIIGRIFSEPPAVMKSLIEKEFGEVVSRFTKALSITLPEVDEAQISWRFHFVIGAMLQTVKLPNPLGVVSDKQRSIVLEELVTFAAAGLKAPLTHSLPLPWADKQSQENSGEVK